MRGLRYAVSLTALCVLVTGCTWLGLTEVDKPNSKGKRESVRTVEPVLAVDTATDQAPLKVLAAEKNASWPLAGNTPENMTGHPALNATVRQAWTADIGDGSGGGLRLLARPLIAEGLAFAMDASGHVTAVALESGNRIWRVSTQAEGSDADEAIGGGIAYDNGRIFATTGHGEVVALSAKDGSTVWRRQLPNPSRAAPTVAEGRVLVITLNNATFALNAKDGTVQWAHNGMVQMASLQGGASPAVAGDVVLTAYSSGEIFALRAQNGRVAWGDVLVAPQAGAMPEMADISATPVIDRGGAFAVNRSGRMAALIMRSGDHAWEVDVGSRTSPVVAGSVVYLLTEQQQLLALRRDNGKLLWQQQLQKLSDPEDKTSNPVTWTGPLLAGGRLFVVNSKEKLVEFSAVNGKQTAEHGLPDQSFIAPIAAAGTLLVVTDNGKLVAFR